MARNLDVFGFLGQLADSLALTADEDAADEDAGGILVHVVPTGGEWSVGVLDLEGRPPAEFLLGTLAPDEWVALGMAVHGWARPLHPTPADRRGRRRSSVVLLVHRSGEVVSRLRVGDDVRDEAPAHGLSLDCIQRALRLPTAPPVVATAELFALMWLEGVVGAAEARAGALSWAEARTLHPAVQLLAGTTSVPGADDPVAAGKALARVFDWEQLRLLAVEGRWQVAALSPTDAAWCDTGAFSRWVMDSRPGVEVMLSEVRRAAGSGVARRCATVLRRLGVLVRV